MKTKNCLLLLLSVLTLAVCTSASAQTFSGSITTSDPTENGRLFRDGIASTCAAPKAFPGTFNAGTPYHYDAYLFTNPFAATTCFSITLSTNTVGIFPFSVAYTGAFDPNNLGTNYLADSGGSADSGAPVTYSFEVPAGGNFTVIVNEVTPNGGVADYSFTVSPAVPEPSTVIELCAGAVLLGVWGWRRHVRSVARCS